MSQNTGKMKSLRYAAPFCVVEDTDPEIEREMQKVFGANNNPYDDIPFSTCGKDIIYGQ